jgi:hypothetical protein
MGLRHVVLKHILVEALEVFLTCMLGRSIIFLYGELMPLDNYTLIREPRGDLYSQLIDYLAPRGELILLVVRDYEKLEEDIGKFLQQMQAFLLRKEQSDRWPGTVLDADKAEVLYYKSTSESAGILKMATSSLYRWQHPHLPEDLCFLRRSGDPLFTSISHEHDAYFSLSEEEFQALLSEAPEIARILRKDEVWSTATQ